MSITGVSHAEYEKFLSSGGELTFEMDASDISSSRDFENLPLIKPFLESGFELAPSPMISAPAERARLFLYGGSWTLVIVHVYQSGGKIIYKKLPSGKYEAKVSVPTG